MSSKADRKPLRSGTNNPFFEETRAYPMMLYRRTDEKEYQPQTYHDDGRVKSQLVVNEYDGKLCDTRVVETADEAEAAAAEGWEISPDAAYGIAPGLSAEASAKDVRIAELEAQLRASQPSYEEQGTAFDPHAVGHERVGRRGPGRPPKTLVEALP